MAFTAVGTSPLRRGGDERVTGSILYAVDITRPGMLWGTALRSPHAHARIVRIDTRRARALPGVHAVITAADVSPRLVGRWVQDQPVLARDRVLFAGERVAAVAAEDADTAAAALELIEVAYEPLPALLDPEAALAPGAPVLHPAFESYEGRPEVGGRANVQSYLQHTLGDADAALARAEVVVAQRFTTPFIHQGHLEPHACVVETDPDGTIVIWTSTQAPYVIRRRLADYLGLPEGAIRVVPAAVGGGFGAKVMLMDEPLALYLSRQAGGRPVKMVMSAAEEFQASNPRHASVIDARLGATRDGRLVAFALRALYDGGAYAAFKPMPTLPGVGDAGACYAIPDLRIEAYCVYTNGAPSGYMRGPGGVQAHFAAESLMDMMAHRLGVSPLELRRRNLIADGHVSIHGEEWHGLKVRDTLERAVAAAAWDAPRAAPYRGRGIALVEKHIGFGESGCNVEVDELGNVTLHTGVVDIGTGAHTILAQMVAEELGLLPDAVAVHQTDTDGSPFDSGSGASRVTHVAGQATRQAAAAVREQLVALAAEALECPPELVRVEGGYCWVAEQPERRLTLAEVARRGAAGGGGVPRAEGQYGVNYGHEPTFGCQVVEVEVDPETGQVRLLRVDAAYDVGVAVNPAFVEAQVHGGLAQGVGTALSEELRREDGRITNPNFGEYKLLAMPDVPPALTVALVEGGTTSPGPYHAKSVGEIVILPAAPAIANAVEDAVGVRITDLPITAEKVRAALRARERGETP